jgi:alpha-ketoglutarate-dependent taurine dioxygenase
MENAHRAVSSLRPALRSVARRARVAAYFREKRSSSSRDSANAMGFALSSISKMRRRLSIRGTIRRWWRLVRTHPAVNPRSARCFNAARSKSSHAWCEGGDTPWCQESAFSFSTLPV